MKKIKTNKFFSLTSSAFVIALFLSACSNSSRSFPAPQSSNKNSAAIIGTNSVNQTSSSFTITSVSNTVTNPSQLPNYNIIFAPAVSGGPVILNDCNLASLTCECVFSWTESVQAGNTPTTYTRTAKTNVKLVQTNLVNCDAPQPFGNGLEVPVGTQIQIKVQPSANNTSLFTTNGYLYTRPAISGLGNAFQDAAGNAFFDIYRYSCYEINQKKSLKLGQTITTVPNTNPSGGPALDYITANAYCTTGTECTTGTSVSQQVSVMSNYHNLFMRSTELGSINAESPTFKCPVLTSDTTLQFSTNTTVPSGGSATNYWPLDTSFALALVRSNEFTVGVEAFTKLAGTGDLGSQQSGGSCNPAPAPSAAASPGGGTNPNIQNASPGMIRGCLGFASKPNVDGSCKPILVSGQFRPTFRLRRYVGIFPPQFQADGQMTASAQTVDTIYVVDRPLAVNVGFDPSTPRPSIRGPKPCPFAYYDLNSLVNTPGQVTPYSKYVSTTDSGLLGSSTGWNGINPDGTEFPNSDDRDNVALRGKSARSTLAILNRDNLIDTPGSVGGFFLKTLNSQEHVYIRPIKAWGPIYHEDTDFQACTPLSSTVVDPPLQIESAPDSTQTWCAKTYPTQNGNIISIPGDLCDDSTNDYLATHTFNKNCTSPDRAKVKPRKIAATSGNWTNFPLLAPAADIQTFITTNEKSFSCDVTWPTSGTTLNPASNCCGIAVPITTTNAHTHPTYHDVSTTHFEPTATQRSCKPPQ